MKFKKGEIQLIEISKDVYGCMVKDKGIGWSNSGFINKGKALFSMNVRLYAGWVWVLKNGSRL